MHQHEREASQLAWKGSHARRWWSRLGRHGAFALALALPSIAVAATTDDNQDRTQDRPGVMTHNQANPATASDTTQTAWDLMVDWRDRSTNRDSTQSNYQPGSTPESSSPSVDPADHPYAQGHFQQGAGHQD